MIDFTQIDSTNQMNLLTPKLTNLTNILSTNLKNQIEILLGQSQESNKDFPRTISKTKKPNKRS